MPIILFISVTIEASSGTTFRGFFLQARSAVDTTNEIAYGEFFDLPPTAKAINCNDVSSNCKLLEIKVYVDYTIPQISSHLMICTTKPLPVNIVLIYSTIF